LESVKEDMSYLPLLAWKNSFVRGGTTEKEVSILTVHKEEKKGIQRASGEYNALVQ